MFGEGFFGGWGATEGGPGFGGWGGHESRGRGGGFGGFGHQGGPRRLKRASIATAAMLLDGPADAAEVVQRVSDKTGGAFTPPQEVAELAIGVLAGRGVVKVDNGVATLTELGNNLLAWRGISSETAEAFLKRAAKFGDSFKIRRELRELAGLARTITWTGTDDQQRQLAETRAEVLQTLTEAKKRLHRVLAED